LGDARAEIIEILSPSSDSDLKAILSENTKEIVIRHESLGKLKFERTLEWYQGGMKWLGKRIELNVSTDEDGGHLDAAETAVSLMQDMKKWDSLVKDFAVSKLLPLKNENWLNEDEKELSPVDFVKRMKLNSITVYPKGRFEFMHDDGDMFWGHAIQVCGSLKEGLTDADIPG
jgi:hypothetical protein